MCAGVGFMIHVLVLLSRLILCSGRQRRTARSRLFIASGFDLLLRSFEVLVLGPSEFHNASPT
jgi:hypothetical protein